MRIIVACACVPFHEDDGARVAEDLAAELTSRGCRADVVKLPFEAARPDRAGQTLGLRLLDLSESGGDRIDRLIAVGAASCALRHPHKTAWLLPHPEYRAADDAPPAPHELYLRECKKVVAHAPPGRRGADWDPVIESLIA